MSTPAVTKHPMRCAPSLLLALSLLVGCSETVDVVSSQPRDGGMDAALDSGLDAAQDAAQDAADADDAPAPDALPPGEGGVALCRGGKPCECDNGIDDDGDDQKDDFDDECTGPYDDDESSLGTGVKEGNPNCLDCFFGSPSQSQDRCRIAKQCSVDGTPGNTPSCPTCKPLATCTTHCLPLTPNGCDCFGCCDFPYQGGIVSVHLDETCTLQDLGNPALCPRCRVLRESDCHNPCGRCELCVGKTQADLPLDCGATYSCSNGNPCTPSGECPGDEYCLQGCCIAYLE
jgi:hypothetical protein